MADSPSRKADGSGATVPVDHMMLHQLVNYLSIVLGHSELLLMELDAESPVRESITEVRDACRQATILVEGWQNRLREP